MCYLCDRETGWGDRNIGYAEYIDLGVFGKLRVALALRGDDIPQPVYSLEVRVNQGVDVLAGISERIDYCPFCGRKLREEEE